MAVNAALIENGIVKNIIYIDQANIDAFIADGMELIDSAPLGLTMGDWRMDGIWYRTIGDDIAVLPIMQREEAQLP